MIHMIHIYIHIYIHPNYYSLEKLLLFLLTLKYIDPISILNSILHVPTHQGLIPKDLEENMVELH